MSQAGRYRHNGNGGGPFVEEIITDSGTATPNLAGELNVLGGTGIATSGSGNTLTITADGVFDLNYTNVNTTPFNAAFIDQYLSVDTSTLAITIRLPGTAESGRVIIIKDRSGNAANNPITVTTIGGLLTIDNSTTYVINTNYQAISVVGSGTAYEVF